MNKITFAEATIDRSVGYRFYFTKGRKTVYQVIDWAKEWVEEEVTFLKGEKRMSTVSYLLLIVKDEKGKYHVLHWKDCRDKEMIIVR